MSTRGVGEWAGGESEGRQGRDGATVDLMVPSQVPGRSILREA